MQSYFTIAVEANLPRNMENLLQQLGLHKRIFSSYFRSEDAGVSIIRNTLLEKKFFKLDKSEITIEAERPKIAEKIKDKVVLYLSGNNPEQRKYDFQVYR